MTATATAAAPESAHQAVGYPSLFLLVLLGALVPVVPTGAVVSSAGAVAWHQQATLVASVTVLWVATAAAFGGDCLLYWLGGRGVRSRNGSRWLAWLRAQVPPDRLVRARRGLERRGATVLLVSRLLPAGRIPVILACLLARTPFHVYLRGALPAALAWAATYQLLGLLGGALFPHVWQGVAVAVALAVLVAVAPAAWRRARGRPVLGGGEPS